jgi:hypothetical protein
MVNLEWLTPTERVLMGAALLIGVGAAALGELRAGRRLAGEAAEAAEEASALRREAREGEAVCGTECSANSGNCFLAGTLVAALGVFLPIDAFAAGNPITSWDLAHNANRAAIVQSTSSRPVEDILLLKVGKGEESETLGVTSEHPFWVISQGWLEANALRVGDQLLTADGAAATVRAVTSMHGRFTVYNLTVPELHAYYVGHLQILVHNGKVCGNKIPNDELKGPPPERGRAPIGEDGKPVELHHRGQKPDSPLDEMTRTDHRGEGNFSKNHENTGQSPSEIDRSAWKKEREDYWKGEWDSGRFDDM